MDAALRHFEAFLAVARLGNFTRAAAALHVSQPALTVQVKHLEHTLGVRLFDRSSRAVSLTDAGRALVAPAERLLSDLEALLDHASGVAAHRRGLVTIAALPSVAAGILPQAIRTLSERHDGITVRVRDVVGARILELVKSGDADFGIGTLTRPDPDVTADVLFKDRMCVFTPTGHALARRRHVRLRDLATYPLILTDRESSVRQLVERALETERLAVRVVQEATYMSTAIAMVRAGLGVAILPESAAAATPDTGVCLVPISRPALARPVAILARHGKTISPAAMQMTEILRAAISTSS